MYTKNGATASLPLVLYANLVSVGSKLLSSMILFRLTDAVDKVIKKNSVVLEKVEDVSIKFSLLS